MNQNRVLLFIAWLALGYALWSAWQNDYAPKPATQEQTPAAAVMAAANESADAATAIPDDSAIPTAADLPNAAAATTTAQPVADAPVAEQDAQPAESGVDVSTDLLHLTLSANGATVQRAELLDYPETTQANAPPVVLLDHLGRHLYLAQTGLVSSTGDAPNHLAPFTTPQTEYRMGDADTLDVPFTYTGPNGLLVQRSYRFKRGSYQIEVVDHIQNGGVSNWSGSVYHQLMRIPPPPPSRRWFTSPAAFSYTGGAWYGPEAKFNKLNYADFSGKPVDQDVTDGWLALVQHYFLSAWIPQRGQLEHFSSAAISGGKYLLRSVSAPIKLAPGESADNSAVLYVGPKLQGHLDEVAPGLELSVDYGIFTVISQPLFWLLSALHSVLGNWGWAIIGVVVLLKALFFKLSEAQFKSMAKMRKLQPRIQALKERYGDDRQKFNEAMMELYKKEKANPAAGCLPILVQIPVFIALYWVLIESVELRHAPWMGWIQDLTAKDPYFILPVLYVTIMFVTQRLSPTPGMDPTQRKMMQAMPVLFGFMFAFFPAGLVLYWVTNGALSLLQQWIIMKRHGALT